MCCSDFSILEGILYHIFANTVKYSTEGTEIKIYLSFELIQNKKLAGKLLFKIIDVGENFTGGKKWKKK